MEQIELNKVMVVEDEIHVEEYDSEDDKVIVKAKPKTKPSQLKAIRKYREKNRAAYNAYQKANYHKRQNNIKDLKKLCDERKLKQLKQLHDIKQMLINITDKHAIDTDDFLCDVNIKLNELLE